MSNLPDLSLETAPTIAYLLSLPLVVLTVLTLLTALVALFGQPPYNERAHCLFDATLDALLSLLAALLRVTRLPRDHRRPRRRRK
ncbi:hypothetical protein [Nocardia takedensis]|uniref:hypothetical protein n=1 Tax=Nocardia takedensis TaxID=259390 RepID=UPI0012F6BCD0|nr:hypothetical protein [Nocardia takedensis]